MHKTHKYQGGVQVLVVLLYELFVVVFRFFAIYFIEVCRIILRGRRQAFPVDAWDFIITT